MKSFSILGGKVHVVELPEGATDPFISKTYIDEDGHVYNTAPQWLEWSGTYPDSALDLPPGNWRIIGMLSEVTEEDTDGLIEPVKVFDYDAHYWNYKDKEYQPIRVDESLDSAIEAEGWAFSNPYGMERPPNLPIDAIPYDQQPGYRAFRNTKPHLQPNDIELSYEFYCLAWQKAQSRVLDRSRCLLLGREG